MTGWEPLLGATLVGSALLLRWPGHATESKLSWLDVAIGLVLAVGGWYYLRFWMAGLNPNWVPHGHDNHDYYKCMVALQYGEPGLWNPFRYPLYPALSVLLARLADMPLHRAGMEVSLASSALVPVGVYVLGRAIAIQPIALVGALVTLRLSVEPMVLGTPTAYPLATALYAATLGTLVFAVREGGWTRHLFAGLTLAAYMATTAKAFPLLWAGGVAILVTATLRERRNWQSVALFFAPLVACWWIFSQSGLPLHPLEGLIHDVQQQWHMLDPEKPFPDFGWSPDGHIADRGFWVVGQARSFLHLDDVLRFLLFSPIHKLPLTEALDEMNLGVSLAILFPGGATLVPLSVFGAAGVWAGGPKSWPRVLATGLCLAAVAIHLWGLANMPFVTYWALPVTFTTPMLLIATAGLAARFTRPSRLRSWLASLPIFAVLIWLYFLSPLPFGAKALQEYVHIRSADPPHRIAVIHDVLPLVQPGDQVVDASETHLARSLFDRQGVEFLRARTSLADTGQRGYKIPPTTAANRWILLDCMTIENLQPNHAYTEVYAWFAARPERFEPFGECLYRDLTPSEPIDTDPATPTVPG